jgi:serine/threonine protein kinase
MTSQEIAEFYRANDYRYVDPAERRGRLEIEKNLALSFMRATVELCEPHHIVAAMCLDSFNSRVDWKKFFGECRHLGKSIFGIIRESILTGYALKYSTDVSSPRNLIHEYCVGIHVQDHPAFVKFYGIGYGSHPISKSSQPFIVMEKINGYTLRSMYPYITVKEYLNYTLQCLYALEDVCLSHFDLHDNNILIVEEAGEAVRGGHTLRFERRAKMIDFGMSYYEIDGNRFGNLFIESLEKYGILFQHNPLMDAYKLLLYTLHHLNRNPLPNLPIKDLLPLLRFFNPCESLQSILRNQHQYSFFYPPSDKSIDDYIALVRDL